MLIAVVGAEGTAAGHARLQHQLSSLPDRVRARTVPVEPSAHADAAVVLFALGAVARTAAENGEGVAVVADDLICSDTPLLAVLDDPRPAARALVARPLPVTRSWHGLRSEKGLITEVASSRHHIDAHASGEFLGVLSVPAAMASRAAEIWTSAAADVRAQGWGDLDPVQVALLALVRAAQPVTAVSNEPYLGGRTREPDAPTVAQVEGLDEEDLRWRGASRGGDGVWSTFVLRPISRRLSRRAVRRGITPNQVTAVSLVVGLLAAVGIATGFLPLVVIGAVLMQVSITIDCVDGEVARSTRTYSAFGAWADVASDRVKEYAVLAAIAVGSTVTGGPNLWPAALAAMLLQLARHMADYAFADTLLPFWRRPFVDDRPLTATVAPDLGGPTGDAVDRSGQGPSGRGARHWVRQAIHMQIGERWIVLTVALLVAAPLGHAEVALVAYLVLVGLGLVWVLAGWSLRTLSNPQRRVRLPVDVAAVIGRLRDDGLLATRRPGPRSPSAWPFPLLAHGVEALALLVGVVLSQPTASADGGPSDPSTGVHFVGWVGAWAFAWGFVVAWHRYDIFYRSRAGRVPVPLLVQRLGLGWLVRAALLVTATALGWLPWLLPIGTVYLFLAVVPESLYRAYLSAHPPTGTYADAAPLTFTQRLGVLRKELRRGIAVPATRLLMRLRAPRRQALVAGLPDSEENSLATAVALAGHYPGEVFLVANDPTHTREQLDRVATLLGGDASRVQIVPKTNAYDTFVRSELVLYTHGLFDSPRPVGRRLHVNLWHGTGPKWNANANFTQRIGAQAHSASSPLWGAEAIRALAMDAGTRIVAGNPREDVSDAGANGDRGVLTRLGLDPDRPLVLWLPTFRASDRAGLVGLADGEVLSARTGTAFAEAAAQAGVQLVAKPHRLDSDAYAALGVPVLSTEQVLDAGLTLYQLIGLAHGLLSDYSSVWVDRLAERRAPARTTSIALYVPDLESYERSRGLNLPDLPLVASELFLDADTAGEFFAAVAAGQVWRPEALAYCRQRLDLLRTAPGTRTSTMLHQLGDLAAELFDDDLGLRPPPHRPREV